ncbi:MAG: hypothetical protein ACOZNI_19340 [Myxococcota bacterium]
MKDRKDEQVGGQVGAGQSTGNVGARQVGEGNIGGNVNRDVGAGSGQVGRRDVGTEGDVGGNVGTQRGSFGNQQQGSFGNQQQGGGSFGNQQQQGGGSFGNQQQQGGGSFGNQQQQGGGSFGNQQQQGGGSSGNQQRQGAGAQASRDDSSQFGAYAGPERREAQQDWDRWRGQDRRINPFDYP